MNARRIDDDDNDDSWSRCYGTRLCNLYTTWNEYDFQHYVRVMVRGLLYGEPILLLLFFMSSAGVCFVAHVNKFPHHRHTFISVHIIIIETLGVIRSNLWFYERKKEEETTFLFYYVHWVEFHRLSIHMKYSNNLHYMGASSPIARLICLTLRHTRPIDNITTILSSLFDEWMIGFWWLYLWSCREWETKW